MSYYAQLRKEQVGGVEIIVREQAAAEGEGDIGTQSEGFGAEKMSETCQSTKNQNLDRGEGLSKYKGYVLR